MKNYLKAATESFEKLKVGKKLINPISGIDAEIVFETINYLKKINQFQLWTILESWKYLKDEEIRDQLLQLNIDTVQKPTFKDKLGELVDSVDEVIEEKKWKKPFVKLKNRTIELERVSDIKSYNEWNTISSKEKYFILINEAEKCTGLCVNILVEYDKIKERDKDFKLIHEWMEQSGDIKFIN